MNSIFEATVIEHQVFSKLNYGIEIFYLENGWAIKSPSDMVSFSPEKFQLKVTIENIDFFVKSRNTVHTEIKSFCIEGSNIFYYQE